MDTKRYDEGNLEGRKADINPNDVDFRHPAKKDKAQEKVDIKESELGRDISQDPANEQIEPMDQIDEGTKELNQNASEKSEQDDKKE